MWCHAHIKIYLIPIPRVQTSGVQSFPIPDSPKENCLVETARIAINNGTTTKNAMFCIIANIVSNIMSTGMTETNKVQKALTHYVKHDFPQDQFLVSSGRAFYPMPHDMKMMWEMPRYCWKCANLTKRISNSKIICHTNRILFCTRWFSNQQHTMNVCW